MKQEMMGGNGISWTICKSFALETDKADMGLFTGWPNKNRTFLIQYFCSHIIMLFLLKCSEITAENSKQQFFKNKC